jgi:nicotinamide mononucleotide (NMN) deamidase PncC
LVLEKDDQQPLGKSQVELLVGRQDFQDLMLNGAMKLWYRNINPSIIGYGTVNAIPNLSPGKYTQISNPNAKLEAFEVNTQTLMQYGQISEQNLGSMVSMIGAADQQMATQAGNGMSATPQGVQAQQQMVDITTNNYQKAIESFFSHYCSYALTMFFQELRAVKKITLTADARRKLLLAGLDPEAIGNDNTVEIDFDQLATEYWVRVIPGSLVEIEDEKQLRILNELFIPLSQAMGAIASTQDQQMISQAVKAMGYIIGKQIELSGSASAKDLGLIWEGKGDVVDERDAKIAALEEQLNGLTTLADADLELQAAAVTDLQQKMSQMMEVQAELLNKLGVTNPPSEEVTTNSGDSLHEGANGATRLAPASA